jgi:hypothetical protein
MTFRPLSGHFMGSNPMSLLHISRSQRLNDVLDERFHAVVPNADPGWSPRAHRPSGRVRKDETLHSGSFLSNRDTWRRPYETSFSLVSEPRSRKRITQNPDFQRAEVPKYTPAFSSFPSPRVSSATQAQSAAVRKRSLALLDVRPVAVPTYESLFAVPSSPLPRAAMQPPEVLGDNSSFSLQLPQAPDSAKQPPERRVRFADPAMSDRIETAQDSDSDSFELEEHRRYLDEVGRFIAAHDFDEQE